MNWDFKVLVKIYLGNNNVSDPLKLDIRVKALVPQVNNHYSVINRTMFFHASLKLFKQLH